MASLPAALTLVGGIVLGIVAIVAGFVGVAYSHRMDGAGEGLAVAGIVSGMFGMALGAALGFFLA